MRMPETKRPSAFKIKLSKLIVKIHSYLYSISLNKAELSLFVSKLGYLGEGAFIEDKPLFCNAPHKIFIGEGCRLSRFSQFLISSHSENGKFIMKKKSGIAQGVMVITNNHSPKPQLDKWHLDMMYECINEVDKDVIVEEDVWIGSYVTLLCGVVVGRGAIVGSNSVVRTNVPPYAIINGNPAKIVGYKLSPEEIIEREKLLYPENERIPLKKLQRNFDKYFANREKIAEYASLY